MALCVMYLELALCTNYNRFCKFSLTTNSQGNVILYNLYTTFGYCSIVIIYQGKNLTKR